jgi:hypothetical protein
MPIDAAEQAVPAVLYKYYPAERIDVLEQWHVRFSSPAAFNDTFDSDYRTPARGTAKRLKYRRRLGIFCLTEDPDNQLMWVHYAEQHKGFVLGFATSNDFFSEHGVIPSKVKYVSAPPQVPSSSLPPVELSLIKSDAWAYEKEWRCVRQFGNEESRDVYFDASLLTEVIIGSRMEWYHVSRIFQVVEAMKPEYQLLVSESAPDRHTWTFNHTPSRKGMCPECDGFGYIRDKQRSAAQQ